MEFAHQSVLLNECIDALAIKPDGIYLDGTLGGAGHSLQICRNLTTVICFSVRRYFPGPFCCRSQDIAEERSGGD